MGGEVKLVIYIYNQNAHIGAVAVSEYDRKTKRTSTSVITRLGHKDDAVAQKAAHLISKATRKPVCLIVGIHLDNITEAEIAELLQNTDGLVDEFIERGYNKGVRNVNQCIVKGTWQNKKTKEVK